MAGKHIVVAPTQATVCTGCGSCEVVCALVHDGVVSPSYKRIKVELDRGDRMMHRIYTCQQCDDHPCYDACPKQDEAMCLDENDIVYVDLDECIGCGLCKQACPFEPARITIAKRIGSKKRIAVKCDMCRTRPEGPACVEHCQAVVLGVSDEEGPWVAALAEMQKRAEALAAAAAQVTQAEGAE